MEDMIKGNRDLRNMENLMGTTNEAITTHIATYDKLKDKILKINDEAEKAMKDLDFYGDDDSDEEVATTGNP